MAGHLDRLFFCSAAPHVVQEECVTLVSPVDRAVQPGGKGFGNHQAGFQNDDRDVICGSLNRTHKSRP